MAESTSTTGSGGEAGGAPPASSSAPPEAPGAPSGAAANGAEGEGPEGGDESLESLRKRLRASNKDAEHHRRAAEAAASELAELRERDKSEHEKAVDAARQEGRAEAAGEAAGKLLELRVRALAAPRLRDAADAVRLLELEALGPDAGDKEITRAIEGLLADKPYLAADAKGRPAAGDQGARGAGAADKVDMNAFLRGDG